MIKICKNCGNEYSPTGNYQLYCKSCIPVMDNLRKTKHYIKKNPNAYKKSHKPNCCVCGSDFKTNFKGKPYCNVHYLRMYLNGSPDLKPYKSKNTCKIVDNHVELKTTRGEIFLVDIDNLELTQSRTWCVSKTGYLVASVDGKTVKLHRYLLNLDNPKDIIDHINGNPLDNRMSNLRICSTYGNARNSALSSKNKFTVHGINITKYGNYRSRTTVDYKEIHLGTFQTVDEAVKARKDAEIKYFGEFAPHLNR